MLELSSIKNLSEVSRYQDLQTSVIPHKDNNASFEMIFESAKNMVNETNALSNLAEEAEIQYAVGANTSTHDLQAAQQKANISLQYTVAVRNAVMDAYKEIMNLSF